MSTTNDRPPQDEGEEGEISMSRHLLERLESFTNPDLEAPQKVDIARDLQPYLNQVDGYLSFGSGEESVSSSTTISTSGQLPVLEWNNHFRKAYTLLLWLRPVASPDELETTILEDDQNARYYRRILYRFATAEDDKSAVGGVCATLGDWRVLELEEDDKDGRSKATSSTKLTSLSDRRRPRRMAHSQLTVYSLPHQAPNLSEASTPAVPDSSYSDYIIAPLELEEQEWSLVGITHVFPYLKRPHWTLCVNGRVKAQGELAYPSTTTGTLEQPLRNPNMNFNTLLQDPVKGGCTVLSSFRKRGQSKPDSAKKASELQTQVHYPRHGLKLHLASFLLSNDAFSPTVQALLAQAGPNMSLASHGSVPTLPPVANWSKGSSLEGPNVGIPLVVHGQALTVQQLAATCILWASAVEARLLGRPSSSQSQQQQQKQRIVCRMPPRRGATYNAPRVGLIQPTPTNTQNPSGRLAGDAGANEDPISLTITGGDVSIHHNLSQYLLQSSHVEHVDTQLFATSKHFSLLLLDGTQLDTHLLLPLFLALPPPGTTMDLQVNLLTNSLRHLYDLYTNDAAFLCQLIRLLATSIQTGGGRWQEHLLQNGSLHVLASCLRQSLVRAEYLRVDQYASYTDFVKSSHNATAAMKAPMSQIPHISPTKIPMPVAEAMADLIHSCCGPPMAFLEELDPSMQIQRTSDMALTALFGIGLDWELWGKDWKACALIMETLASRYGGSCVTAGYILRSQISVQFFLDTLQLALDTGSSSSTTMVSSSSHNNSSSSTNKSNPKDNALLERIANACALLLKAMLLSSLSNTRSISQGEHDIGACLGALSDCPLGSVGAHVIFTALIGVLQWCEVLPPSAAAKSRNESTGMDNTSHYASPRVEDEHKSAVATRLGRNLMISQYHDVVAPMLLSRTVFSGERTMNQEQHLLPLQWEHHWRLGLLIFSWVSTLAGPEGVIAAKSLGSLLLASGLAGSLTGALPDADTTAIQHLFLPPPTMALTIAASSRKFTEWSYTDLLSDRLAVMMPLLPGLVVSLVSHPSGASNKTGIPPASLKILAELLSAVGGNFYRVVGGQTHSAGAAGVGGNKKTKNRQADSIAIQAAKAHIPHLLVVVMVLEHHLTALWKGNDDQTVSILKTPAMVQKGAEDGSWVEVSSTVNESCLSDGAINLPKGLQEDSKEAVISALQACQSSMLTTISELMTNAMRAGGGEASTMLLRSVLRTLQESATYADKSKNKDIDKQNATTTQANVLCRLAATALTKSLKRDYQWEVWHRDLGSGISRLCLLIEEKELLMKPMAAGGAYSNDQVVLLCALLNVLKYGRDTTGWCQLILPTPPGPVDQEESQQPKHQVDAAPASSKVMLPVLQPALRCIIECVGALGSSMRVQVPMADSTSKKASEDHEERGLLDFAVTELRETLMAAIVGMSFANARDVALHALATLRRARLSYQNTEDKQGLDACNSLMRMVTEEVRVRYKGERRRRETALFDAYEENENANDKVARAAAVADSQAIENMILGGDLIPMADGKKNQIEEVSFVAAGEEGTEENMAVKPSQSEDFLVFNDGLAVGGTGEHRVAKMQWSQYEGLSAALEECSAASKAAASKDELKDDPMPTVEPILKILSPFLDSWDENAAKDAAESELVNLFDSNLSSENDADESDGALMPLQGSETAADSMSTFIELSAAEKARMAEVANVFLPNHRHSTTAYAERFCWARYNEIAGDGTMDTIWERGIADGNRDIRSRLVTIPCSPQFKRYIPKYLDHGAVVDNEAAAKRASLVTGNEDSMDEFTKALVSTGHLEIVDITKKEVNEEEEPELEVPAEGSMDFDEFGEAPMEAPTPPGEKADDDSSTTETASATDGTTNTEETTRQEVFDKTKIGSSHYNITASAFASPPDNSSSTLSLMHSAAAGLIEKHLENCLHVKAEGSRKCSMLLTSTHLILEYDIEEEGLYEGEMMAVREEAERQKMIEDAGGPNGKEDDFIQGDIETRQREAASMRPKSIRWNLSELSHVYLRRYRLRDSSVEMFFIPSGGTSFGGYGLYSPSTSLFLDFGPGYEGNIRRDEAAFAIMKRAPPQAIKQWPDRSAQFLHEQLSRLTMGWVEGRITNFDYLLHLNILAGRSYNDTCQYPVMPWVLSNYKDEEIPDLCDPNNFRDLTKPIGALNPDRLEDFIERFNTFADPSIPPFMYGSHYSTNAGVVLHFLVRLHPFAGLHRQLQGGHFDVADRLFSSVPRTWDMCTGSSAAEVKELTPEWYCNPAFLKNNNKFKLGTSQDGELLGDVMLPPWANGSPEIFVELMRNALESDICSSMLPDWIDLIFGRKQQGPEAIKAHNVFFYLTYYGSVDVAAIEDESLRQATELQIAHFGQCPMQLFVRPHVRRISRMNLKRMSFYQVTSAYTHGAGREGEDKLEKSQRMSNPVFGQPLYLPFFSAPMSHWVHLAAPPPGPHANLLAVRLAGTDRCLAVDAHGVFHCFRWAWKPEDPAEVEGTSGNVRFPQDGGCFIAQRELPRFRTVPRLVHTPRPDELPAVAITKTLFAGRSVLLVLSDGDGRGGLAMQLVDPAKGSVRGEAVVELVHSSQITCIATDPIGTAAGHGGVGGELAILGSSDGCASIWRFMSSHYLPLRPRVRLAGHAGAPIAAVGLSASINIAATVSSKRLCLHSIGNGNLIRVIQAPQNYLDLPEGSEMTTTFASSPAVAISVQGFVVTVCEAVIKSTSSPIGSRRVVTLHLFSLEGVSLGCKPLESWRGVPHKMSCTPDGTAVLVCSGRGVTIHRLSAITPLEFIDEWHITETEELSSSVSRAWDVDLGPSLNRPVVAAAACSNGSLRLHALSGISAFAERHKKLGLGQSVGSVFAAPARRIKTVVGKGWGIGSKVAGVGKEISKEIQSDMKEKGVGGFIGNMFRKNDK